MSSSHGWMLNVAVYLWLFYSFYVSEENESDVWNNISLINESNDENDWQFSNNPCQTSSKSTQDYGLPFVPSRMPQVLSRSPAPSSGLSSPNRPIVMKESILWKYKAFSSCQFYVGISATDPNGFFPLCSMKRNKVSWDNRQLNLQVLLDFLIQILSKFERSKHTSRAFFIYSYQKINTSQNFSRANIWRVIISFISFGNN